ncbi:MAG TPA: amidohydrolase, partial [Anaerolineae bacterium]|nr:amidohydrolase [Anaerolineae bacterium]
MAILILPSFLITTGRQAPKKEWGVRVAGNQIVEVGPNVELKARYPDDLQIDGADQVLAPGFVNAHVHLYGVLAHGIPLPSADSTGGEGWAFLDDFWWPLVEDALDHEMICAATDWVCAEMLRSGVTSFYDIL